MSRSEDDVLGPLSRLHGLGCGTFLFVEPQGIPSPFHSLLVHEGDMTSRLENFHRSGIELEVLQSRRSGEEGYSREVLLRRISDGAPVEYGAIEIELNAFHGELRAKILEGRIPLGGLLNSHGVQYHSEPRAFFKLLPGAGLAALMETQEGSELYGRCNRLRCEDGKVLARIVEVLPTVRESDRAHSGGN